MLPACSCHEGEVGLPIPGRSRMLQLLAWKLPSSQLLHGRCQDSFQILPCLSQMLYPGRANAADGAATLAMLAAMTKSNCPPNTICDRAPLQKGLNGTFPVLSSQQCCTHAMHCSHNMQAELICMHQGHFLLPRRQSLSRGEVAETAPQADSSQT